MPRALGHRGGSALFNILKKSIGSPSATQELRWLRQSVTSLGGDETRLENLVRDRAAGTPLQYLIGHQPFGSLSIRTRPPTLIPRPETEQWTENLVSYLRPKVSSSQSTSVLDFCTGTGCIPLLLAHTLPTGSIHALGVDVSPAAVALAKENVAAYNLQPMSESSEARNSVDVVQGDLFSEETFRFLTTHPLHPFNVLTCNPPYIPISYYERLSRSVKNHEDPLALIGVAPGINPKHTPRDSRVDDGLAFYRHIATLLSYSPSLLAKGGMLVLEVGVGQAQQVSQILLDQRRVEKPSTPVVSRTEIQKDVWGIERVVIGWT